MHTLLLPIAGLILFWSTALHAQVHSSAIIAAGLDSIENVSIHYYKVTGNDLESVKKAIRYRGPKDGSGIKRDALTKWKLYWKWIPSRTPEKIDGVRVSYEVDIYFPRWSKKDKRSTNAQNEWDRYSKALALHEAEHVRRFLAGYPKLKRLIDSQVHKKNGLTTKNAQVIAESVIQTLQAGDDQLDRETDHGLRNGVFLNTSAR